MKLKPYLFLLISMVVISCKTKPNLIGTWFHVGLIQTENTFLNSTEWKKAATLHNETENPVLPNQRTDLFYKLVLKEDNTFTEQLFEIRTNKPFENVISGTWKAENTKLILSVKIEKAKTYLERSFLIQNQFENSFNLKIIKEIATEKGQIISDYNLAEKEKRFAVLIKQVGLDNNDIIAQSEPYWDDFWDLTNFGKYQILIKRQKSEDDISKYSVNIQNALAGSFWNDVPYYEPIFENTHERVIFNKNNALIIRYQVLNSAMGGCGTLSNENYLLKWSWDKANNQIIINNPANAKTPFEVLKLFRANTLKTEKFKVLAKSKFIMIWEKTD